jgi:hypothetical protein
VVSGEEETIARRLAPSKMEGRSALRSGTRGRAHFFSSSLSRPRALGSDRMIGMSGKYEDRRWD